MTRCDKCGVAVHRNNSVVTTDGTYLTRYCMGCVPTSTHTDRNESFMFDLQARSGA